jgi:hypothetical protein
MIFLLPIATCLLLHQIKLSVSSAIIGVALAGFASGAELDVMIYLAARYFGLRNFAAITGLIYSVLAALAGFGPFLAAVAYDRTGNYAEFLLAAVPVLGVSAGLIWLLPPVPRAPASAREFARRAMS